MHGDRKEVNLENDKTHVSCEELLLMSYWTDRQEQLKKAAEKDEAKLKRRLSDFYDKEFKRLEKEIAAYYQQYGEDNVISYRTLLQSLSDEDRRLLMERMDEFVAKYPQYANLMPVRESIYKLDRLQGLQYSVYMTEAEIAGYTNEQMTGYLTKLSQKGVNYGMETLGFGAAFYAINADVVKQFVDVPWCNGENFSTRIWNDTQKLAQYLNQDLAQGFARGDSYEKLVRNLRQRFGRVNRKDAYRLVYTEGTYVMAEATMQPFKDNFEKYRLSPVLDGKTCPICRGLREKVFLISERQPGVNFPPIHPWCRCSWEIVVDDWDAWMDEYVAKHSGDRKQAEKIATRLGGEMEFSPRKATGGDYGVDWPKIQSSQYRESLEKLSPIKKVVDTIETRARWALSNRDGLRTEELYAVSLDKGEEIASILNQQLPFRVERTKRFNDKLDEADSAGEKILLLHNHPRGYPPSTGDINALYRNKNVSGITVGHDGSIYYYTRPQKQIEAFDFAVAMRKYKEYTQVTGQEKALEDLSREYGFIFRKLSR